MINISKLPETYFSLILYFWYKAQHIQLSEMEFTLLQLTQQLDEIFDAIKLAISGDL